MTFYEITKEDHLLIDKAMDLINKNFDNKTFHHTVGCAVKTKSGKIITGMNCDAIHGSCAEFITIGKAISEGERDFDTIVAVQDKAPNGVVSPCGNCRQMLFEYAKDIKVIVNNEKNELVKVQITDLLPFAYELILFENLK